MNRLGLNNGEHYCMGFACNRIANYHGSDRKECMHIVFRVVPTAPIKHVMLIPESIDRPTSWPLYFASSLVYSSATRHNTKFLVYFRNKTDARKYKTSGVRVRITNPTRWMALRSPLSHKRGATYQTCDLVNTNCFSNMIHNIYFQMLMTPYNNATTVKFTLPRRHDEKCVPVNCLYL